MATRLSNPAPQHFDKATKDVLSGGKMFFFEANASTTPKNTFSDSEGLIPNANPVILDANGVEPDIFGEGSYRVVLQNSAGVQQWERDPVNFETVGGAFAAWLSTVDYSLNNTVEASDSDFYSSIKTPNINNDPTSSPTFWSRTDLLKRWNTNETYSLGDPVTALDSSLYISQGNLNVGNDPTTDTGANWSGSGQIKLIDVQVANVSSTIEFTTGIDSTFIKYIIELVSVVFSDNTELLVRSSSNGGSSYDSGATDYGWFRQENRNTIATPTFANQNFDSSIELGGVSSTSFLLNGEIVLFDPSSAGPGSRVTWDLINSGFGTSSDRRLGNGSRFNSSIVNAIQIFPTSGTITSGTFKLYGLL